MPRTGIIEKILDIAGSLLNMLYRLYQKTITVHEDNAGNFPSQRHQGQPAIYLFWCAKTLFLVPYSFNARFKYLTYVDLKHSLLQKAAGLNEAQRLPYGSPDRVSFDIIKELERGYSVGVVADGPYGPAGTLKDGILKVAAIAKVPVITMSVNMKKAIRIPWRWDKYEVSWPFSEITVKAGDAIMPNGHRDEFYRDVKKSLGGH